jgi:hypothetical protein
METMIELKKRHQKEFNGFEGIFFAFSDKQLREGLLKVGLDAKDTDKIFSIGAGGYIRKDRSDALAHLIDRQKKEAKICRKANKQIKIHFVGVDYWGKANFRTIEKPYRFYACLYSLFADDATEKDVLAEIDEDCLCFCGNSFGCEPMGTEAGNVKIVKN